MVSNSCREMTTQSYPSSVDSITSPKSEISSLNRVHNFLEVFTVVDIATGDSKHTCHPFLNRFLSQNRSTFESQTEHPSPRDFRCWAKYLPSLVTKSDTLCQPLGR